MAHAAMPPVEALRIHPIQLAHPSGQISLRRFNEQVVIITHQTVGMAPPGKAVEDLADDCQEAVSISVVHIDCFTPVPARGDMVDGARKFHP
jgi:hypothetical protein